MDKAKLELFKMKMEKIHEDDQTFILGIKACIDYMKEDMMHKCDIDISNGIQNRNLDYLLFSNMNRFFNFVIESCEDAMFEKMDEFIEYAEEQEELDELEDIHEMEEEYEDFDLIPPEDDDYDIPDPEWMECDNECASCSSDTCNHRTEDYQVVDDIYDPDAYLYREVAKK